MAEHDPSKPVAPPSFAKRDFLLSLQEKAQARWEAEKVFEVDAVQDGTPKYMVTFPYPYMNGKLHLGHTFTLTKTEFAVGYWRLKGRRCLWPFGFHCTGMPIAACAKRLGREIEMYGCPPKFPVEEEKTSEEAEESAEAASEQSKDGKATKEAGKFKGKKSKAAAKGSDKKSQWEILESLGIAQEDIPKFVDPLHWLSYFPPLAVVDLKRMGCKIDFRRSFITTDVNPYYDSFVRWQFETLKELGRLEFGKRFTVFSPLDGQACADHDRSVGEGVNPQEYTVIKMRVLEVPEAWTELQGRDVFLAPATLRPETMYGQTNCFVLPDGEYGAFEMGNGDVFVISERAARNFAFQGYSVEYGKTQCLRKIMGTELIGLPLHGPNCPHERIYALPMLTISMEKGTGVVTSVPSDAPDDYVALLDLRKKPKLREKYGVAEEWVNFDPIPIIHIPEYGDLSAVKLTEDLNIQSQNDREKLKEAKERVYLKGFYEGVLTVGPHKGKKVLDAKDAIRQELLEQKLALPYAEPEGRVVSRSGDECVVSLCDQWFINYGEDEWRSKTEEHLENMELFASETTNAFRKTFGWLRHWACSRSFGLGTRLPWDEQYLIESLSDSTLYMSYYTVAHILQNGVLDGSAENPAIKPEQMTPAVWNYVFGRAAKPDTDISDELLEKMCTEFNYWYPFDLRVSGKDLINNHLTFCLYNHTAVFPQEKWPRGFRCNGHLLMNGEKMAKSTGNFLTLEEAIERYSADVMRLTLADAGDMLDDANFVEQNAFSNTLKLTALREFFKDIMEGAIELRQGDLNLADKLFMAEIDKTIRESDVKYERMLYRDALNVSFFEFMILRDTYRLQCGSNGMHNDVIKRFCEVQTLLITPFVPHWAESCWELLGHSESVMHAKWPASNEPDAVLLRISSYLSSTVAQFRQQRQKASKATGDTAVVLIAEEYPEWMQEGLAALVSLFDESKMEFPADIMKQLKAHPAVKGPNMKKLMPFLSSVIKEVGARGKDALDLKMPFDEKSVLEDSMDYLCHALEVSSIQVFKNNDDRKPELPPLKGKNSNPELPGAPRIVYQ